MSVCLVARRQYVPTKHDGASLARRSSSSCPLDRLTLRLYSTPPQHPNAHRMADSEKGDLDQGRDHRACEEQAQALPKKSATSLKRKLDDDTNEEAECALCLDAVTYPVELQDCRHQYCCEYLYTHVNSGVVGGQACPLCRRSITKASSHPSAFLEYLERDSSEKRLSRKRRHQLMAAETQREERSRVNTTNSTHTKFEQDGRRWAGHRGRGGRSPLCLPAATSEVRG